MRYESVDDVRLRLHRSVVRLGDSPVFVEDVIGLKDVMVTHLLSGNTEKVKVDKLDLSPVPLGYVLTEERGLLLATRKPTRKFKQGLTQENLFTKSVLSDSPARLIYTSKSMAKTIVGDYPTVGDAFQRVRSGSIKACPFSREWAVADNGEDLCVVFRGEVVGYVGDNFLRILPERAYLKESLQLCLK